MTEQKKLIGEERRSRLLQILKETTTAITGSVLAAKTEVSRQAIVGDINLLKARNEPIIATSQGYIYLKQSGALPLFEKTIACCHLPDEVEIELNLIVDHGVTVKDVQIEHPVYGNLNAAIMVSNRKEVKQFMERIASTRASFLSELTFGIHLHTLSSTSREALKEVENKLKKAGFLLEAKE
ncbi:transcription repressor NadR [Bacillus salipaludis]|uniref:Transcription repressor NadR n=1 Tax=Bacillus salipaludis TaxID=2547811 RepID=A0ABW8RP97_9BACI